MLFGKHPEFVAARLGYDLRLMQFVLVAAPIGYVAANGVEQASMPNDAPLDPTRRTLLADHPILETHRLSAAGQLFKKGTHVISIFGNDQIEVRA